MTYYSQRLAGERLRQVYAIAPPRIRQYLRAEIEHVRAYLSGTETVLELGCGYGRVLFGLEPSAKMLVGVDTARESLRLGQKLADGNSCYEFLEMDAACLALADNSFDLVICVQNGICAFHADQELLVKEALRVTRPGGKLLLSTYSSRFWEARLAWFELQAEHNLVGPIDYAETRDGTIVCTDGFSSGTFSVADFTRLGSKVGIEPRLTEVDGSSLFCELTRH
jgi:2-polyprenyl-6-hydroxyphenyl methylase/3-demethylubiquinone-9 3-methyltransferase